MTRSILVLGGTSAIIRPTLLRFCEPGDRVLLAGRNPTELARVAADVNARCGSDSVPARFDACVTEDHPEFVTTVLEQIGCPDVLIVATGVLGDQGLAANSPAVAVDIALTNYVGITTVLSGFSKFMEDRGSGQVVVLSSVAGDRGRASNYTYGAAKAGMNAYLQGLRNRLDRRGVNVLTIKLGFIDTPMIYGKAGVFLAASADSAARGVCRAMARRRDIAYVPWFWRPAMLFIRMIPEPIFKRLSL